MKDDKEKPSFSKVVNAFNEVNEKTREDIEWDSIFENIKTVFIDLDLEIFSPGASVLRRCITLYKILNKIEHSEGKGLTVKEYYLEELKLAEDEYIESFKPFLEIIDTPEKLVVFSKLFGEVDEILMK